jgi:hypothetical protein
MKPDTFNHECTNSEICIGNSSEEPYKLFLLPLIKELDKNMWENIEENPKEYEIEEDKYEGDR